MASTKKIRVLSDADLKKQALSYVRYWQRKGFAPEWHVRVEVGTASSNTQAWASWDEEYRNVSLFINRKGSHIHRRGSCKHIILHELLHLVQAPAADWITKNFTESSPFRNEYMERQETVVDYLTNAIWRLTEKAEPS